MLRASINHRILTDFIWYNVFIFISTHWCRNEIPPICLRHSRCICENINDGTSQHIPHTFLGTTSVTVKCLPNPFPTKYGTYGRETIAVIYWLITVGNKWINIMSSVVCMHGLFTESNTVETLYSTIYYSKYFIELNIDKSTQYVALWTHKIHPIPRPFGRAMECLLWVLQQKLIVL